MVGDAVIGTPINTVDPPVPPSDASSRDIATRPAHQEAAAPPPGGPDALDPAQVVDALQRGMPDADQTPAVHPNILLAQNGPQDEREDPSDPVAGLRMLDFNAAINRLREIDPNNPELTSLAPPNSVPTQDAIDRVHDAIAGASAKQAGLPVGTPSWQQPEQDTVSDSALYIHLTLQSWEKRRYQVLPRVNHCDGTKCQR